MPLMHSPPVPALMAAHLVNGDDVGMLQARRRNRLGTEPAHKLGRRVGPQPQHLDRHNAIEALLSPLEHHPHPPFTHSLHQFVIPKRTGGRQ